MTSRSCSPSTRSAVADGEEPREGLPRRHSAHGGVNGIPLGELGLTAHREAAERPQCLGADRAISKSTSGGTTMTSPGRRGAPLPADPHVRAAGQQHEHFLAGEPVRRAPACRGEISTRHTLVSVDPRLGVASDVKRVSPSSWVGPMGAGMTAMVPPRISQLVAFPASSLYAGKST